MGYYVQVQFHVKEGDSAITSGEKLASLVAEVSVAEDENSDPIAFDSFVLDFRRELKYSEGVTATIVKDNTP